MDGAELLIKTLEDLGTEYIFGIPGDAKGNSGNEVYLARELKNSESSGKIKFIRPIHEQTAAIMADVYGRLTGNPGICYTTLGPGATNIVTDLKAAYSDRSPVVAISAQLPIEDVGPDAHQYVNMEKLFSPITKYRTTIERASEISYKVEKCFDIARVERPGPVHIELPVNVLCENFDETTTIKKYTPNKPIKYGNLALVAELIENSEWPLVVSGNAVIRRNASSPLIKFIEKYKIPVLSTFQGKGSIPENHPLYLGVISRHIEEVKKSFERADLIINIGYDYVEGVKPSVWDVGLNKTVIHIDTAPHTGEKFYHPDIEIVNPDLRGCLEELCESYNIHPKELDWNGLKKVELFMDDDDSSYPMNPKKVVREIRKILSPEDIVTVDVGLHKQYMGLFYPVYEPKTIIFSNGDSRMGFGFPAAMGAKLIYEDKNVLAVCGDGGFQQTSNDFITAVNHNLPVTVLIMNNSGYGIIKYEQKKAFGGSFAVDFKNPDFVKLAESYGGVGYRIEKPEELGDILDDALKSGKASIIDVPIKYAKKLW